MQDFTRNDQSSTNYSVLPAWKKEKEKKKTQQQKTTPWKVLWCNGLRKVRPLKLKEERKEKKYQHLFWKYSQPSSNGAKFWRCCCEFWSIWWHLPLEDTLSSCCKLTRNILLSTDFTRGIIKLIQCVRTLRGINWLLNLNQLLVNISYWNKRKLEQWLLPPTILGFIHSIYIQGKT